MEKKLISAVFIMVLAAASSADAGSKGGGERRDGTMRPDHPKDQTGYDRGGAEEYRKESKEKVRRDRDIDVKDHREESYRDQREDDKAPAGLDKQRVKKTTQEQKELGRGSDQGQQSREERSLKWWKFWGE